MQWFMLEISTQVSLQIFSFKCFKVILRGWFSILAEKQMWNEIKKLFLSLLLPGGCHKIPMIYRGNIRNAVQKPNGKRMRTM